MRVLVAGDYSLKYELSEKIKHKEFTSIFGNISPCVRQADIAIVNFETTIKANDADPIKKCGPALSAPVESVEALKFAGFNVVTLANNHFYDYGMNGVQTTLGLLDAAGIDHVGGGKDLEEAEKILYLEQGGIRLAIINCCEHEFSIATKEHGGCNPLNPVKQFYAIQEAREHADHVIVIVHGGHEYYQLPSTRMQDTYRFFIDAGADAVINHHQHCFSGMEVYNRKPIFYGLGNFLFDTKNKAYSDVWHDGFMIILEFEKDAYISYQIIPYRQCDKEMGITPLTKKADLERFHAVFAHLSNIITDRMQLETCQKKYYRNQSKGKLMPFEPWRGRLAKGAYSRGWLKSCLNSKVLLPMLNFIACESHRDILAWTMFQKMEGKK